MTSCSFCSTVKGNRDNSFVIETRHGVVLVNYSQTFYGRCMYICKEHVSDITEIEVEKLKKMDEEIAAIARVIKKIFAAQLINIASLGNHVQHLHWHIIPRYTNDPNWGNPPWPHEKVPVSQEELLKIAQKIKSELTLIMLESDDGIYSI